MTKPSNPSLRCAGMISRTNWREYGFIVESQGKEIRRIVLTIDNSIFRNNLLMMQEAPDLCYQKLLSDLERETDEAPISRRAAISAADIADYRNSHPAAKMRSRAGARGRD